MYCDCTDWRPGLDTAGGEADTSGVATPTRPAGPAPARSGRNSTADGSDRRWSGVADLLPGLQRTLQNTVVITAQHQYCRLWSDSGLWW